MSYDLMAFRPESAPRTRNEFMNWFEKQARWEEEHDYNDPAIASPELQDWFHTMIKTFPALNGPYSSDDFDNDRLSDYCTGKEVIYVAFGWTVAEQAYSIMKKNAEEHNVGFFDVSAKLGAIMFPNQEGQYESVDELGQVSSILQVKKSAEQGQENDTVAEIIFSRLSGESNEIQGNLPTDKPRKAWWKRLFKIE
jgi:hypothetical protein